MWVTLAATSRNVLMDTQKSSICKHYFSEHNSNVPPCLSEQFDMLTKCTNKFDCVIVTSHAKTFRMVSRFKTDSRSPAVRLPFEWTGMPFERLVLSVLENSSSV